MSPTLIRSLDIVEEINKTSIALTDDLAIAKMALQIQHEESPKFDILFVNLAAFHIELSFFHAIATFIGESGWPYILIEAEILGSH